MLRLILAALIFGLAGCSDPVADAEAEHRIALKTASNSREKCEIENKLTEAYLKARLEEKYAEQKLHARVVCLTASIDAQGR